LITSIVEEDVKYRENKEEKNFPSRFTDSLNSTHRSFRDAGPWLIV
jgi:hypothetical protein